MTLKLEERDDLLPLCPYCEEPLEKLYFHDIREAMAGKRMAYFCPHCQVCSASHTTSTPVHGVSCIV